jgi:hypothetical protein
MAIRILILCCPVPNIWLRPNNQLREAGAAKARLTVPEGDHLTLLNVYNQYTQSEPCVLRVLKQPMTFRGRTTFYI